MQSVNYFHFNDILVNPKGTIPRLSERSIRVLLIDVIVAYFEKRTRLKTDSKVASLIKKYNKGIVSANLKNDLDELRIMYI